MVQDRKALRWILLTGAWLLLFFALPAAAPLCELAKLPEGWSAWDEADRLMELARTSFLLCALTLAAALPAGVLLGFLLARTDLPCRRLFLLLILLAFFLPVPLVAAGWRTLWSALRLPASHDLASRLLAAAGLHALLALPWVALIAGFGFRAVEPELEEEALLFAPPARVFRRVTWPRTRAILGLAAGWVFLLTWQEITITDLFQVRTFGEEVYQQFSSGREELARAAAAAAPLVLLLLPLTVWALARFRGFTPSRHRQFGGPYRFPLGRWRLPALLLAAAAVVMTVGVPAAGLVAKAGLRYATAAAPGPPTWEPGLVFVRVAEQFHGKAWLLAESVGQAAAVGLLAALGALWLLFLARQRPWLEGALFAAAALLLALPGPIIGVGLLTVIETAILAPGLGWLSDLLYSRPSPLPTIWADLLRFGPVALLFLWPVVRLAPLAHEEEAWLNGAGPLARFRLAYLRPLAAPTLAVAVAVATLALGEISASKMVATPGDQFLPLAHQLFLLMHASADTELAALGLCLMLLALGGGLLAAQLLKEPISLQPKASRRWRRRDRPAPPSGAAASPGTAQGPAE